ncbi:MAG: hypothetical protein ACI8RY_000953, partial [Urechidicola sp.]
ELFFPLARVYKNINGTPKRMANNPILLVSFIDY